MKIGTCEPAGIPEPAAGWSSTTTPSRFWFVTGRFTTTDLQPPALMLFAAVAWSWPTTFGTGLVGCGFGPADTMSATRELRRAVEPAAGTCSSTRFAGLLDLR